MKAELSKLAFAGMIGLAAATLISGCGKSGSESAEQKAEQQAVARHEKEVRQQRVQWREFQKLKKLHLEKWPAGPSTIEAAKSLGKLLKSGRLPDTKDARHSFQFNIDPFATNYPMSRTFNLQMQSSRFVNHYTLVKVSADSSWQLKKAWRTDSEGNIVKIYPVDNLQ